MRYDSTIFIQEREISISAPTYFIADLASNHDGDLKRAKELIFLAKEAGADAVKFQHFKAEKIVSHYGFSHLGIKMSHQSKWKKSVFDIYKQYECNREWTRELYETTRTAKIDFLTSPYDREAVELLDKYLPAYKIGSGDITWIEMIELIAKRKKPVMLATGASGWKDVVRAVEAILKHNKQLILLQCNTNYTGSIENFKYVNLKVLESFKLAYPQMIIGLSDHTPQHSTVLGAITLGARVIEKHFTDDNSREGPDHSFAMNPQSWREMIARSRELEQALGDGFKKVEDNEKDTVIIQRRSIRILQSMKAGQKLQRNNLTILRPVPYGALEPYLISNIVGRILKKDKLSGDALFQEDLGEK